MRSYELASPSVGGRIRELRKSSKPKPLTQRDLVTRIKKDGGTLTESTLSLIENGKQVPRESTVQRIAAALRVPTEVIYGQVDSATLPPSSLAEIREVLERYKPLRGNELAIDRVIEQVRLWSISLGSTGSE